MRWWKVLGVAGLAGVATSGAVLARRERARRAYTPEQVHQRLRERAAEQGVVAVDAPPVARPGSSGRRPRRISPRRG